MKLNHARAIAGSLGHPSKMPGTSYGISAQQCHTGAKLAQVPGSVCHGCYAMKGNYIYASVKQAHETRLAGLDNPQWENAMVTMLEASGTKWHRWHDSGDLQSVKHLGQICGVAARTPNIWHWLPTRELKLVQDYVAMGGHVPSNLVIRVSATMIDGPATKAWPTTSTVHTQRAPAGARSCPAPSQGNQCGTCRTCWRRDVAQVSYHKH